MKTLSIVAAFLVLAPAIAFAGQPKSYQVTGPVLQLTDDLIVVQKGTEKWEIARSKDTTVTGDLKVGAKVTIQYRMTAASVDVPAAKPASPPKTK